MTPFSCMVKELDANKESCVASQKDCDCKTGQYKCPITKVCVDDDKKFLCPFNLPINCLTSKNISSKSPHRCPDGICRKSEKECSSPRVCPIGYIMCPDLSCRTDYKDCIQYETCGINDIRCTDQSCVTNQKDCPSTITCSKAGQVVCPDGECVSNEIYCRPLPTCNAPNSILCSNNVCVSDVKNCPKTISCGHEKALCEDIVCKDQCSTSSLRMLLNK